MSKLQANYKRFEPKYPATPDGEKRLEQAISDYMVDFDGAKHPTLSGFAHSLGFASVQSIYDYMELGDKRGFLIARALLKLHDHTEQLLFSPGSVHGAIFALSNIYSRYNLSEDSQANNSNKIVVLPAVDSVAQPADDADSNI